MGNPGKGRLTKPIPEKLILFNIFLFFIKVITHFRKIFKFLKKDPINGFEVEAMVLKLKQYFPCIRFRSESDIIFRILGST